MTNNLTAREIFLFGLALACFLCLVLILALSKNNITPPSTEELNRFLADIKTRFPDGSDEHNIRIYFEKLGFKESSSLEEIYGTKYGIEEVWIFPTGRYNPPTQFNDGRYNQIYKICKWNDRNGAASDATCFYGLDKFMY